MGPYDKPFSPQEYLMHYGVKGMKWGVRRYQNKDGTLTKAGKERYSCLLYTSGKGGPGAHQAHRGRQRQPGQGAEEAGREHHFQADTKADGPVQDERQGDAGSD